MISPGQGQGRALLEEDPQGLTEKLIRPFIIKQTNRVFFQAIRESLEDAYALQEFSVLLCDQVRKSLPQGIIWYSPGVQPKWANSPFGDSCKLLRGAQHHPSR